MGIQIRYFAREERKSRERLQNDTNPMNLASYFSGDVRTSHIVNRSMCSTHVDFLVTPTKEVSYEQNWTGLVRLTRVAGLAMRRLQIVLQDRLENHVSMLYVFFSS